MKTMHKKFKFGVSLILIAQLLFLCSCGTSSLADKVWAFSQGHPEGFTLDVRSMTEPSEGIAVSYAATQDSHSRNQLNKVVNHALQQDGYVGGWYNREDGLYYFDSTKLFPENALKDAIQFGKENGQHVVFMLSSSTGIPLDGKVADIVERGTILIGTTGDYRPLSFCEEDGTYWGFGIEVAKEIAKRMGVGVEFRKTSWPTLTTDVLAEPQKFDLAIGGITITDTRRETMLMSEGYLANGKTILCRTSEADRYKSLADIDRPEVRVMVNPGGLNEKFANENLTHATIIVHPRNEEIPSLIAEGEADVMITEITEAPYYVQNDVRLAAPLLNAPFNHGEIGVLMQKGQEDLLQMVNATIRQMKADGSLRKLHEKYGLVYSFATDTLSTLRSQIDEIDSQLVDLLGKRMRISREIGQYKKEHGMNIIQSNRFNEILEKRCAQGALLGIDSTCVKNIFEAIHRESVNQQKEIQSAK